MCIECISFRPENQNLIKDDTSHRVGLACCMFELDDLFFIFFIF